MAGHLNLRQRAEESESERESVDIRDLWLFILLLSPSAGDADIDLSVVLIAAAPCSPFRRPLLPPSLLPPFGVGGGVQRGVTGVAISLTSLSSHYKHGPQPGSPAPHAHPLSLSVAGVVTFASSLRSSKWGIMRINRPCALHLLPSPSFPFP